MGLFSMTNPAKRKTKLSELESPGDFYISGTPEKAYFLVWKCFKCDIPHSVPVRTGQKVENRWYFNGDADKPSLEPSIRILNPECGWHGYLTNGEWITLPQ